MASVGVFFLATVLHL